MKKFTDHTSIHLADTDMTGVIFFPKLFEKCLIVLENFLTFKGLKNVLITDHLVFPVVSSHGQYLMPVTAFDALTSEMTVTKIGDTSISFCYKFINKEGLLALQADIIHVCVDKATKRKKALPDHWIEIFQTISH